jgi:hypothetical protein
MLIGLGAFVVLFIIVLLLINFITNKEEGTLAGIDFKSLGEDDRDAILGSQEQVHTAEKS